MSTKESIDLVTGKVVTTATGFAPSRDITVTSVTKDGELEGMWEVARERGNYRLKIPNDEVDLLIDALLEHQAVRGNRLPPATTIAETEARRKLLREQRLTQQAATNSPGES